jgi:hypothetical protein
MTCGVDSSGFVRGTALKMSDVFTFSSYWSCLYPAGLRRTQELMNAKLKTGTEDKKQN